MKMNRIVARISGLAALSALGLVTAPALAATDTEDLSISASVENTCVISATSAVAFGSYDPTVVNQTAALDGAGSISVTCTSGAATTITLDQGAGVGGGSDDAPVRLMKDGANALAYNLFVEPTRTTLWGNTPGTGLDNTGNGGTQIIPVYGRIPGGQNVPAGDYTDTVVATITF